MGEAWSCPCGEREERRREVKTGKAPVRRKVTVETFDLSFLKTSHPFKIAFVPTASLEAFFLDVCVTKHIEELFPSFVFQSPLDPLTTTVLFLPKGIISDRCSEELRFKVHPYTFPGAESEITTKHLSIAFNAFDREGKLEIIGAVPFEDGLKVVYGMRSRYKTAYSLVVQEMKDEATPQVVCNYLSLQYRQGNAFRFTVTHKNRNFVVCERMESDGKDYVAADYDLTFEMESLRGMPEVVHGQLNQFTFEGVMIQPSTNSMLLVFKVRE